MIRRRGGSRTAPTGYEPINKKDVRDGHLWRYGTAQEILSLLSGDGGNRTRVRKNRPSNIYECRWFLFSLRSGSTNKPGISQLLRPESPLSYGAQQIHTALQLCDAHPNPGWRSE